MSLASRVSDLATAIGQWGKGIDTRIDSVEANTFGGITYQRVYVTTNWATDPKNPANGGTLPIDTLIIQK